MWRFWDLELFDVTIIYYLLVGGIVGFLSSTLGLGGSIFVILVLMFDTDNALGGEFSDYDKTRFIIANTMAAMVATNGAVAMRKNLNSAIDKNLFLYLAVPAVVIAAGISLLIVNFDILSHYYFTVFFLMIMAYTCIELLKKNGLGVTQKCELGGSPTKLRLIITGTLGGIIPSISAAESLPAAVPLLNKKCGFPVEKSIAVFSTTFYIISVSILVIYLFAIPSTPLPFSGASIGYVVLLKAIPLSLSAFATSYLGHNLFKRISKKYIAYVTFFVLLLFTLRVLLMDVIKPLY